MAMPFRSYPGGGCRYSCGSKWNSNSSAHASNNSGFCEGESRTNNGTFNCNCGGNDVGICCVAVANIVY